MSVQVTPDEKKELVKEARAMGIRTGTYLKLVVTGKIKRPGWK